MKLKLIVGLVFSSFTLFSQNVGINTTSPNSTLEVKASGNTADKAAINITNADSVSLLLVRNDGNVGVGTSMPGAKFMVKGTGTNPTLNVVTSTGTIPALRVNDNGRIGVGTDAPGALVSHSTDQQVSLKNPHA